MSELQESRTVSLKLIEPPDKEFWDTISAYTQALNFVSEYVFENGKTNPMALQTILYNDIRERYGLKSQMAVNVFRQVSSAYRSAKKNKYKRREPIKFNKNSVLLNFPRDFKVVDSDTLSIGVLKGRKEVKFVCGPHQRSYIENGWEIKSSRLIKRKGDYYLNVSLAKDFVVAEIEDRITIVGVDLGINNIAVGVAESKTFFAKGGEIKNKKRQYERVRGSLQSKGTRSSKRVLQRVSGRERRFMTDVNHCVAKDLVQWVAGFEKPIIALEDLKGIKRRVGIRKNRKSNKGSRRAINKRSYYQLRMFIEYKAHELGIPVVYVDPAYTSQHCPRCGHTEEGNRVGKNFTCLACKYQNNADVVGAMNIRTKTTSLRYILEEAGRLSIDPEVATVDAEVPSGELMLRSATIPLL